jgi:outer membrane protein assembly factor BamB
VRVDGFTYAWRASIGDGNSRSGRVTGAPVIAGGRIFAVDGESRLTATSAANGARLWSFDSEPAEDRSGGEENEHAYDFHRSAHAMCGV